MYFEDERPLCVLTAIQGTGGPVVHPPAPSRGAIPFRILRLALVAALAAALGAAVTAPTGALAAPATAAPRLAPPKLTPPKKPKKSARPRHRGPTARASLCSAPLVGDWRS